MRRRAASTCLPTPSQVRSPLHPLSGPGRRPVVDDGGARGPITAISTGLAGPPGV